MDIDVSIIIPLYNESHILEETLSNLIGEAEALDLKIEFIVIDDCSTDESFHILKKFSNFVKILQTPNNSGGAGIPRNMGLRVALGDYISFYDIGDIIDLKVVENIIETMRIYNLDLSICKHIDIFQNGNISHPLEQLFSAGSFFTDIHMCPILIHNPFSWSKIYKRDFVVKNNIVFGNQYCGEDKVFTWHSYLSSNSILVTNKVMYGHRFFGTNINRMLQRNLKLVNSIIEIDNVVRPFFKKNNLEDLYNSRLLNRDICGIILDEDSISNLKTTNEFDQMIKILSYWLPKIIKDNHINLDKIMGEEGKATLLSYFPSIKA